MAIKAEIGMYTRYLVAMKINDYIVNIRPPRRHMTFFDIDIIKGDLHIRIAVDTTTRSGVMDILEYIYQDNKDAIHLMMAFEPIFSRHDYWFNDFALKLIKRATRWRAIPDSVCDRSREALVEFGEAPKRAYDVINNIKIMQKNIEKGKYSKVMGIIRGSRYLLQNFKMSPRVRRELKKLIAIAMSKSF